MPMRRISAAACATLLWLAGAAAFHVTVASAATLPAPYVVVLAPDAESVATVTDRLERSGGFVATGRYTSALRGFAAMLSDAQAQRLAATPGVLAVEPDTVVQAAGRKSIPAGQIRPVGVPRVDGGRRAGATVAVLDTGLDLPNGDLNIDRDDGNSVNCVKPAKSAQDDNGHGTHVGGTIGAYDNAVGAVGVAPGTRLISVKVLDSNGKGLMSGLLCGIDWVSQNAARLGIRVANVSVTASGRNTASCGNELPISFDVLHDAVCATSAQGVLFVAAAGNVSTAFDRTVPAAYPEVLTVTAMVDTDGAGGGTGPPASCDSKIDPQPRDDVAAAYSNVIPPTDPAAGLHTLTGPGTCIVSTRIGGGTITMEGTSMAAPHVAAAAALCIAGSCAGLATADVIARLRTDAAARAAAPPLAPEPGFGFIGDPLTGAKQLGYLVTAAY